VVWRCLTCRCLSASRRVVSWAWRDEERVTRQGTKPIPLRRVTSDDHSIGFSFLGRIRSTGLDVRHIHVLRDRAVRSPLWTLGSVALRGAFNVAWTSRALGGAVNPLPTTKGDEWALSCPHEVTAVMCIRHVVQFAHISPTHSLSVKRHRELQFRTERGRGRET
jgi:hypothetical protein